ncbi:hypothetical protein BD410DRAFT_445982 [Rickenella mellea]|uniref:Uncharacterized protein n=1 Tax=Rickenella mellea TaxID=50990 RepID=A0A4Y7PV95_9AGAM|nr:hypothetical protein BD410DRAFT_445982 [Rickenella mellea]
MCTVSRSRSPGLRGRTWANLARDGYIWRLLRDLLLLDMEPGGSWEFGLERGGVRRLELEFPRKRISKARAALKCLGMLSLLGDDPGGGSLSMLKGNALRALDDTTASPGDNPGECDDPLNVSDCPPRSTQRDRPSWRLRIPHILHMLLTILETPGPEAYHHRNSCHQEHSLTWTTPSEAVANQCSATSHAPSRTVAAHALPKRPRWSTPEDLLDCGHRRARIGLRS